MNSSHPIDPKTIRLSIVDDHPLFGEGLKNLLEFKGGFQDCRVYQNAGEALKGIPQAKPHLSLIDINLPDMDGVDLARRIISEVPGMKVLMLTVDNTRETVIKAISVGAHGYLLKSASFNNIMTCIFAVLEGDIVIGPEIAPKVIKEIQGLQKKRTSPSPLLERLGPRETEVLKKVAGGQNNQSIAEDLFISEKTVKNYISHLMDKLEVDDRMKLIVFAIREGFLAEE
ncbi:MAG TPA: response regulator transcription factor [Atribacteraceae bacterium]|nr:response regulator transcription factor [Atribacteraceae bacterium]